MLFRDATFRSRLLVVSAAVLTCAYALGVIAYSLYVPDLGMRCAFSPVVNQFDADFLYPSEQSDTIGAGDVIVRIGGRNVSNWPQFLRRIVELRNRAMPLEEDQPTALVDPKHSHIVHDGVEIIRVEVQRPSEGNRPLSVWCRVGRSPLDQLAPTVLWFFLKAGLFLVGALVYWKRPRERSARQFFWLCVVSCGAYVGGYLWLRIATQPTLLLVFIVSAVLLPPVSFHFYLVFPRPKQFFEHRPRTALLLIYGPPVVFLLLILSGYLRIRWLMSSGLGMEQSGPALELLLNEMLVEIYVYFGIAFLLWILSIASMVHSYRTAQDATERNQVKWILFGAVAALMPMGYSLYLALVERERFGGGGATWPMFFASACVTVAFTISITRYKLMQLDQLVSSGAAYFAVMLLAALVYYGLILGGVVLLGSKIIAAPSLIHAVGVGATVLVLVVALDLVRGRLMKALDRHYRREKSHLDRTMQRMSEAVAQLVDPPTLARRLLQSMTDLLGVERGAVYLRQGDPPIYRLADYAGPVPGLTELSSGCPLVEDLAVSGSLRARSSADGAAPGGTPGLRQLQLLGGEVGFALSNEGQMLALLVLGPKRHGPYTGEDLNLLAAFAQVTVLALVSGEGGRTIDTLNRELQSKVEKIAEQQRRILALQSQLLRRSRPAEPAANGNGAPATAASGDGAAAESEHPPAMTGIVGSSPAVQQLLHLVRKVAASSSCVLLRGESGTGKELLARGVHELSPRADRPFVKVHCAALSPGLLESELFGHVKGAFTGAVKDRPGRFELANGGTLFLDEIGDVSWEVQTKLLRVLQEMTFERVGSSEPVQVDVRVIAATHQNLESLIRQGRFREDLFYRLNVLPIQVPPLRERSEDIPELVQHFLNVFGPRSGKGDLQVDDDAMAALKAAPWPGNIRQLENAIERAAIVAESNILTEADLSLESLAPESSGTISQPMESNGALFSDLRADRDLRDREQLVRALSMAAGNKAEAARLLGLKRSTLLSRLKKYGLS